MVATFATRYVGRNLAHRNTGIGRRHGCCDQRKQGGGSCKGLSHGCPLWFADFERADIHAGHGFAQLLGELFFDPAAGFFGQPFGADDA